MKRRAFIAALGWAAAWPLAARAQQAKIPRIGIIDDSPIWNDFRQGLRGLGYPICPKCGRPMVIVRIEPDEAGHQKRTYECSECELVENLIVKHR